MVTAAVMATNPAAANVSERILLVVISWASCHAMKMLRIKTLTVISVWFLMAGMRMLDNY